ncbi:hypothetical protein ABW19_dt0209047 [Dactylella cylindrospora]|nr:hypothetical protein ABW19_dt0209047 [Dactylella cylindrospora]
MNGFGPNPSSSSSSSAASNPSIPPTAATPNLVQQTSSVNNNSTFNSNGSHVNHSASTPSTNPSSQFPNPTSLKSSNTPNTLPNNNVVVGKGPDDPSSRYPPHDPNSVTGKRKRADSSPVKELQGSTTIPFAQRQQLLSDIRRTLLSTLSEHDAGISLLDRPVSPDETAHEPKKSKTQPNSNGLETLRQRLNSDSFYTSLPGILKDVNGVANEALEAARTNANVAPEDEMKDDDATISRNDAENKAERIQKFKQIAQNLITQTASQHPYLNAAEEKESTQPTLEDIPSLDETKRDSQWAITVTDQGKVYYTTLRSKDDTEEPITDTDISQIQQARFVKIFASNYDWKHPPKFKNSFVTAPNPQRPLPRLTIFNEKQAREERKSRAPSTYKWLSYGDFMSFAPTQDQGGDVASGGTRSQAWYGKHGEGGLKRALSDNHEDSDDVEKDDAEFKQLAESYEPIPIDPALFESETPIEKAVREISDALENLYNKQYTRLAQHTNLTQVSKPDSAEATAYREAEQRIVKILSQLDPESCDSLDKAFELYLETKPALDKLSLQVPSQAGTMPNPREAPPPAAIQTPAPQQYTTRVSIGGEGSLTPTARVVSTRTHPQAQYARSAYTPHNFPQTPPNRSQYNPNNAYFTPQPTYPQPRQPSSAIPQYQGSGYANSPFSRTASGSVPRITSSGQTHVYIQQGGSGYSQPAIRQTTGYYVQGQGQTQIHHQTPRRVSMVPQHQQQQQQQQQQRPPSSQAHHYTPGHTQYTQMAQQMQQTLLRQQPQHQPTPGQGQFSYSQQQIRPAVQSTPSRSNYPAGYQALGRMISGPPTGAPSGAGQ